MESPQGRQVVTGLKHDSRYEFRVVLTNAAGRTSNFTSGFNTTVGEPTINSMIFCNTFMNLLVIKSSLVELDFTNAL